MGTQTHAQTSLFRFRRRAAIIRSRIAAGLCTFSHGSFAQVLLLKQMMRLFSNVHSTDAVHLTQTRCLSEGEMIRGPYLWALILNFFLFWLATVATAAQIGIKRVVYYSNSPCVAIKLTELKWPTEQKQLAGESQRWRLSFFSSSTDILPKRLGPIKMLHSCRSWSSWGEHAFILKPKVQLTQYLHRFFSLFPSRGCKREIVKVRTSRGGGGQDSQEPKTGSWLKIRCPCFGLPELFSSGLFPRRPRRRGCRSARWCSSSTRCCRPDATPSSDWRVSAREQDDQRFFCSLIKSWLFWRALGVFSHKQPRSQHLEKPSRFFIFHLWRNVAGKLGAVYNKACWQVWNRHFRQQKKLRDGLGGSLDLI